MVLCVLLKSRYSSVASSGIFSWLVAVSFSTAAFQPPPTVARVWHTVMRSILVQVMFVTLADLRSSGVICKKNLKVLREPHCP